MIFAVIGLFLGVVIGVQSGLSFPASYSAYVALGILACIDSLMGGIRSALNESFQLNIFVSGFFGNAFLAILLIWLGGKLNIQLSLAAVVVFGSRVFQNFAYIRRFLLNKSIKQDII